MQYLLAVRSADSAHQNLLKVALGMGKLNGLHRQEFRRLAQPNGFFLLQSNLKLETLLVDRDEFVQIVVLGYFVRSGANEIEMLLLVILLLEYRFSVSGCTVGSCDDSVVLVWAQKAKLPFQIRNLTNPN